MITKKIKLTAIAILGFSSLTFGQDSENSRGQERGGNPPSVEQIFKEMDANEDGKLSQTEVKGPLKKHFSKIDANEDGFLTQEEVENGKPKGKGRRER